MSPEVLPDDVVCHNVAWDGGDHGLHGVGHRSAKGHWYCGRCAAAAGMPASSARFSVEVALV